MQIEWMENDFRNLTTKVWENLDNPIKRYDFFKVLVNFLYAALSGGTVLISVNGTVHKFHNILTFHENASSLYFYTYRYVRVKMIVHAFMIELNQLDYWYPRKNRNCEILCTKSMESSSSVISQILA